MDIAKEFESLNKLLFTDFCQNGTEEDISQLYLRYFWDEVNAFLFLGFDNHLPELGLWLAKYCLEYCLEDEDELRLPRAYNYIKIARLACYYRHAVKAPTDNEETEKLINEQYIIIRDAVNKEIHYSKRKHFDFHPLKMENDFLCISSVEKGNKVKLLISPYQIYSGVSKKRMLADNEDRTEFILVDSVAVTLSMNEEFAPKKESYLTDSITDFYNPWKAKNFNLYEHFYENYTRMLVKVNKSNPEKLIEDYLYKDKLKSLSKKTKSLFLSCMSSEEMFLKAVKIVAYSENDNDLYEKLNQLKKTY